MLNKSHARTKNAPQYLSPISSYEVEAALVFLGNYKQSKNSVSLLRIVATRLFAKTTLKRQYNWNLGDVLIY